MIFVNAETNSKIHIGRAGEHLTTTVVFDITEWLEQFSNLGTTTVNLVIEQNSLCYMQETEVVGNEIHWKVTKSNTAEPGIGKCELFLLGEEDYVLLDKKPYDWDINWAAYYALEEDRYVPIVAESAPQWEDNKYYNGLRPVVKSAIYEIIVTNALGYNEEEPPEPYESWVDNVLNASTGIKQAGDEAIIAKDEAVKAKESSQAWATGEVTTGEVTREVVDSEPQFKNNSKYYSIQSKSWAIGGTGKRDGEDTNNAEYFAGKADESAILSKSYAVGGTDINHGELDDDEDNAKHYYKLSKSYAVGGTDLVREDGIDDDLDNAKAYSIVANEQAKIAKSYAVGGTDFGHDGIDDDFDNAKYYATKAKASESAASNSATNASTNATNAAASATNAAASATNAAASASAASSSATNAAASESAASSSATNAAMSADKAEKYGKNPPKPNSKTKTWWVYDPDNTENEKDKEGYVDTNAPYSFHFDYIVENQTKLAEITGMKTGDMAAIQAAVSDPMNAQLYIYTGNGSINGWEFLLDLSGATGNGISSIDYTSSAPNEQGNIVDTYTITYTLSDPTTFTVVNGKDGADGIGSGDMLKKDYDQDGVVKTAGGIVKYVESKIQESGTGVVWKKWISTDMI